MSLFLYLLSLAESAVQSVGICLVVPVVADYPVGSSDPDSDSDFGSGSAADHHSDSGSGSAADLAAVAGSAAGFVGSSTFSPIPRDMVGKTFCTKSTCITGRTTSQTMTFSTGCKIFATHFPPTTYLA